MADTVKIYIDDQAYDVPKGTNLVDAAKWVGNDIPVFCYHPKMKPVGMCRMCLVEMGSINRDRATGEVVLDDKGNPTIRWFPKLQTACTTTVSDGLGHSHAHRAGHAGARERGRVPADQPPARLPDLRQGRRVPAAKPDDGLWSRHEPHELTPTRCTSTSTSRWAT